MTLDYSDDYFKEHLGISKREYNTYYKKYIVNINGNYFFKKKVNKLQIQNEIIGRYLSRKIELETTDLKILSNNLLSYTIITPNYRNKDYEYTFSRDHFTIDSKTKNFDDTYLRGLDKDLKDDVLRLIALDLMMEQKDRHSLNTECRTKNGITTLAPIIDFEASFLNEDKYIYYNPYILLRKSIEALDNFYNKYPNGYHYLEKLFSITSEEIFDCVESNYHIKTKTLIKKDITNTIKKNNKIINELNW